MELTPACVKWAKLVLLIICCFFILSGAVNNGFSRWAPAIPFLFLAIWSARDLSQKTKALIAGVMMLLCWIIWPSEDNSLIYPHVGEPVYLQGNFVSIKYSMEPHNYIYSPDQTLPAEHVESRTFFGEGPDEISQQLVLSGVKTSHPDFSLKLHAVLTDNKGNDYLLREEKLKDGIKDGIIVISGQSSLNHFDSLQTRWSYWLGMGMAWPVPIILLLQNSKS